MPLAFPSTLPTFLKVYKFYEMTLRGRRSILLVKMDGRVTPAQVAKHLNLVSKAFQEGFVIYATPVLSSYNRARLVAQGVAFIVPGNQLYIPGLAIDLREHFLKRKQQNIENLPPVAQALLFHHILRLDEHLDTPTALAKTLDYSAMSIGRAFDDLVASGLASSEKRGKVRHLSFSLARRDLFEKALPLLRTPVRARKYLQNGSQASLKWSGESALSELSDVSPTRLSIFAISAARWKSWAKEHRCEEVEADEADCVVETWSYDPDTLSIVSTVDPLSLYIQFHDHQDERLAIAAETLLERISW